MSAQSTAKLANPDSLGLLGFCITTILLNLHNTGFGRIFCELSAIYSAMRQSLNAEYGREIVPLG